jgi:hypothetical protein
MATVSAYTECQILVLKRNDFLFMFGNSESKIIDNLSRLIDSRQKLSIGSVER